MSKIGPEREEVECNECGTVKTRLRGPYVRGQYQFLDVDGKQWARRKCPECKNKSYSAYNSKYSLAKKSVKDTGKQMARVSHGVYITKDTKLRPCRKCTGMTTNYYYCVECYASMRRNNSIALAENEFLYG
jgi:hypothetical protein